MSAGPIVILLVALLTAGTLLAAQAGIRSIQRARKVVFYRTRRSYMLAGWQWLVLALVLLSSTVASALFGGPVANQLFPSTEVVALSTETFSSASASPDFLRATSTSQNNLTPSPTFAQTE